MSNVERIRRRYLVSKLPGFAVRAAAFIGIVAAVWKYCAYWVGWAERHRHLVGETWAVFFIALAVATGGCNGARIGPNPEDEPGVRDALTYVNLQPLTGRSSPIGPGDLQGHVVLLNIWGWWCPWCREELPHIAELRQRFAGQTAFRLVVVSYPSGDAASDVESLREQTADLLKQLDLDLPTVYDPDGKTLENIKAISDFAGFPTTLLLDRHGVIRAIWKGYAPGVETEMERYIAMVLAEEKGKR